MNNVSDLFHIVEGDLERVFVMEQRQFISMPLKGISSVPPGFEEYARVVGEFNAAFDEHRVCQEIYASSMERKTRDNARILDAKNNWLHEKFIVLKPVIMAARERLCRMVEK